MAGQLKAAGKVVLFQGFKEMLLPYLDIEPLMPPERLRWSRILGRPLMEQTMIQACQTTIAAVMTEEMQPYPDCEVFGYHQEEDYVGNYQMRFDEIPEDPFWLYIVSEGDDDFAAAWLLKHGHEWPFVVDRQPHPALANLHRRYMRCWGDWHEHGSAIMEAFHNEYTFPTTRYTFGQLATQ